MSKTERAIILVEREKTHGNFTHQAAWAQQQKEQLRKTPQWTALQPAQREALEMIQTKFSRILFGKPSEPEHWLDISGYANLGKENCVG